MSVMSSLQRPLKTPLSVMFSGFMLLVVVLLALFSDRLAPYAYDALDITQAMLPPAFVAGGATAHPLGTDFLGRDIFSRLLYSIRLTIVISVVGTLTSALLGTTLGILSGYRRGLLEETIMAAVDIQSSLPFIIFALTMIALLGSSIWVLLLIVAINGWENYARLARGAVLSIKERDYVLAAQSLGIKNRGLYWRHILPNVASIMIVEVSFNLAGNILLETALSFLGLGVEFPMTSLGQMLGDGRDYLLFAPWMSIVPGTTIFLIIMSVTLIGDWFRDRLDPRN
jgi:peptide/nickel transport system permease protein